MCISSNNLNCFYKYYIPQLPFPTLQEISTEDAIYLGMSPKTQGHCCICPLGCLFLPICHPNHQKLCNKLLIFANNRIHSVFRHQIVFKLCPHKIHGLKQTSKNKFSSILTTLERLSINEVPPEVKMLVRLCNTSDHQYNH